MTEYEKGFLEALQLVCFMGRKTWDAHLKNAEDETLCKEHQNSALESAMAIGTFISDIKKVATQVRRKEIEVHKLTSANITKPYWWATEDGKGAN